MHMKKDILSYALFGVIFTINAAQLLFGQLSWEGQWAMLFAFTVYGFLFFVERQRVRAYQNSLHELLDMLKKELVQAASKHHDHDGEIKKKINILSNSED